MGCGDNYFMKSDYGRKQKNIDASPESDTLVDELHSLAELLSLTKDAFDKARQKEMDKIPVHERWGAILWAVYSLGNDATLVKIAHLTARRRHTISHMVSKLEQAGLIEKIRDLDRKNRVRAVLTEKGKALYKKQSNRPSIKRMISVLSPEQREQMIEYMEIIYKRVQDYMGLKPARFAPFPDDPYFYLFRLVVDSVQYFNQIREQEAMKRDIGVRRDAVISAIQGFGSYASPAGIARHLQRRCNSITYMLAKLEEERLIIFVKHPRLEKRKVVKLTPKGYKKYCASITGAAVPEILSSLSRDKRDRLRQYLKLLHAGALNEIGRAE
jgi:DNA-binding MarR family transcriptional regulator